MRTIRTIAVLLAVTVATTAEARIGETLEQCTARYGKEVVGLSDPSEKAFRTSRFTVIVEFCDLPFGNTADEITYLSTSHDEMGKRQPISPDEIEVLLKANGGKMVWVKQAQRAYRGNPRREWEATNGLHAVYFESEPCLIITTEEHRKRQPAKEAEAAADKKAKERDALKGF